MSGSKTTGFMANGEGIATPSDASNPECPVMRFQTLDLLLVLIVAAVIVHAFATGRGDMVEFITWPRS